MRVLLDECVPKRLRRELTEHFVSTVPQEGFAGLKNGKLLAAIQDKWDVLLSYSTLAPWIPEILHTLPFVKPGTALRIGDPKLLAQER